MHHLCQEKIEPLHISSHSQAFRFVLHSASTIFFPFWKTKYTDYTAFQKGIQLLPISKRNTLLK